MAGDPKPLSSSSSPSASGKHTKEMEKVCIINSWSNSSVSRVGKPDEVIVGAKYAVFKDPLDDYEVREDFYDSCGSEGTEEASEQKRQKP